MNSGRVGFTFCLLGLQTNSSFDPFGTFFQTSVTRPLLLFCSHPLSLAPLAHQSLVCFAFPSQTTESSGCQVSVRGRISSVVPSGLESLHFCGSEKELWPVCRCQVTRAWGGSQAGGRTVRDLSPPARTLRTVPPFPGMPSGRTLGKGNSVGQWVSPPAWFLNFFSTFKSSLLLALVHFCFLSWQLLSPHILQGDRSLYSIEQNRQLVSKCPSGREHVMLTTSIELYSPLNDFWIQFVKEVIS